MGINKMIKLQKPMISYFHWIEMSAAKSGAVLFCGTTVTRENGIFLPFWKWNLLPENEYAFQ